MTGTIRAIRGYVSMGIGFVACPCHLPLTLPVLLSLTAGTALGAWLRSNTTLVYVFSTIVFMGGFASGTIWLNNKASDPHHQPPVPANVHAVQVPSSSEKACKSCHLSDQSIVH